MSARKTSTFWRWSPRHSGIAKLRVVETGGNAYEAEREQWDDGNNVVAMEPGVVVAYDRNTHTNTCSARPASR